MRIFFSSFGQLRLEHESLSQVRVRKIFMVLLTAVDLTVNVSRHRIKHV